MRGTGLLYPLFILLVFLNDTRDLEDALTHDVVIEGVRI
jgi:hypothetical protein